MEKENWIKWLQARIPELKKSHNEFWIALALDGYLEGRFNEALRQSCVGGRSEQLVCDECGYPMFYHKPDNKIHCHGCENIKAN
jgi:hypothetical protein